MKLIPISKGLFAMVDDEDFEHLNNFTWSAHIHPDGGRYAVTHIKIKPPINGVRQRQIKMHRIIMGCTYRDGKIIDHIDGNGLNNQKSNLRFCTCSENGMNRKPNINGTSKYKGVSLSTTKRENGKVYCYWVAGIKLKKYTWLGCFKNETDAAKAYNDAALKYFGEFANLNIID